MKKSKKTKHLFVVANCICLLSIALLFSSCTNQSEQASQKSQTAQKVIKEQSNERTLAEKPVSQAPPPSPERQPVAKPKAAPPPPAPARYPESESVTLGSTGESSPPSVDKAAYERSPASETKAETTRVDSDKYKVVLGADSPLEMPGAPGELKVWIGFREYEAYFREGMKVRKGELSAVGDTAQVTADAPGFEVEPKKSICMKIDPSGSEVRFSLTPKSEGEFHVGATIQLFDSEDCSGTPIPKAVESLQVTVKVDRAALLFKVLWEKFLEFWGAALALIFALLLFFLRKQFKKWFGLSDNGQGTGLDNQ